MGFDDIKASNKAKFASVVEEEDCEDDGSAESMNSDELEDIEDNFNAFSFQAQPNPFQQQQ